MMEEGARNKMEYSSKSKEKENACARVHCDHDAKANDVPEMVV